MKYTTKQASRAICLTQTGFTAFDYEAMLFRESPYAETEQLSPLTSLTDVLATPFMLNHEGQTQ